MGQTRSAALGALLLHTESSLHVRDLARLIGASPGSLHRELRTLADLGLLVRKEVGRQVHYQANTRCPVYAELAGLLRKTAGLIDVLRDAELPVFTQFLVQTENAALGPLAYVVFAKLPAEKSQGFRKQLTDAKVAQIRLLAEN